MRHALGALLFLTLCSCTSAPDRSMIAESKGDETINSFSVIQPGEFPSLATRNLDFIAVCRHVGGATSDLQCRPSGRRISDPQGAPLVPEAKNVFDDGETTIQVRVYSSNPGAPVKMYARICHNGACVAVEPNSDETEGLEERLGTGIKRMIGEMSYDKSVVSAYFQGLHFDHLKLIGALAER